MPYRAMWDMAYWGLLGVRTTLISFRIFVYNKPWIRRIEALGYGVFGLQSFVVICEVRARIRHIFLMDTTY
uniref:Uncharacterized protein n=1 Tax=Tanacetum cinerariifolium TaxID=118510 RepID=A0A6L2KG96_TANCI|nr:hypothetical protein [Tanacetum cinerariifolium]